MRHIQLNGTSPINDMPGRWIVAEGGTFLTETSRVVFIVRRTLTHRSLQRMRCNMLHETIIRVTELHRDQVDKVGQPYILHVLRVMLAVQGDEERLVALLHDVVEDGHASLHDLRAWGYAPAVVEALDAISRRFEAGETYQEFIARVQQNPLATRVKLADLHDNLGRLERVDDPATVAALRARYMKALEILIGIETMDGEER